MKGHLVMGVCILRVAFRVLSAVEFKITIDVKRATPRNIMYLVVNFRVKTYKALLNDIIGAATGMREPIRP